MRALSSVAVLVGLVGCGGAPEPDIASPRVVHDTASGLTPTSSTSLSRALTARLTVWVKRDGTAVLARHCRSGPVDCRARIASLAGLLSDSAKEHGLDPFVLAAIAVRESMLDPAAIGALGEAGIVQLHPRGVGRGLRYVVDDGYRDGCQIRLDACQGPVLQRGARALSEAIAHCGGVRAGIGRYASGRCNPDYRYVDRVLTERDRLRSLAR